MIPKLIHQMFVPPAEDPGRGLDADILAQCDAWRTLHPGFRHRLWNLPMLRGLCVVHDLMPVFDAIQLCRFPAMQADLARLAILSALGGFWADLRLVPQRGFLPALSGHRLVLAEHFVNDSWVPGLPCSAFIGAEPGHPFLHAAIQNALARVRMREPRTLEVAGPGALHQLLRRMRNSEALGEGFHLLRQDEAWGVLFANGSSSYNRGHTGDLHWSLRERHESPYLDPAPMQPSRMPSATMPSATRPPTGRRKAAMPVSSNAFDSLASHILAHLRPGRVLDIGPGAGKFGKLVRDLSAQLGAPVHTTALEIDSAYVSQFELHRHYDEVVVGDALGLLHTPRMRCDLAILGDCLEHMRKSHGLDLLNFLIYRSAHILVLWPDEAIQDDWEGHAAEAHISTWSPEDFRPWKVLHASTYSESGRMNLALIRGYQPARAPVTEEDFRQWQETPFVLAQAVQPRSALDRLREKVAAAPGDDALLSQLGYALMEAGRFAEAREAMATRLRPQGNSGGLLLALSHASNRLGHREEALGLARAAAEASPRDVHAHMHLAYLLLGSGVLEEARKALTAALSLKPNEARAYEALSTVHERAGRPDQALAAIEAALQLAPDNALYRQRRDRMAAPSS